MFSKAFFFKVGKIQDCVVSDNSYNFNKTEKNIYV